MSDYVTDTHSLIWWLGDSPRLSEKANAVFDAVDQGTAYLIVPAIVLAELIYIVEHGRVKLDLDEALTRLRLHRMIEIAPLLPETVLVMRRTSVISEMHDRLIACEALLRGATLITRDSVIADTGLVPTVW